MITRLKPLTPSRVHTLKQLFDTFSLVQASSHRLRMGENGAKNLSTYYTTRWFTWRWQVRDMFKLQFPEKMVQRATVGWFLYIPPEVGFLDRMTAWVGKEAGSGTAMAYAMQNGQTLLLNDREVTLNRGEGIGFNLSEIHEIKPSAQGQLWACVMVRGAPNQFDTAP
jgi:hypothetical protein